MTEETVVAEETSIETTNTPKHLSLDEWTAAGKDPEAYKGKLAFEKDKQLFDSLQKQQYQINDLKSSLAKASDMFMKSEKLGYEKAISDLKEQQQKAVVLGDEAKVSEITDKLLSMKEVVSNNNTSTSEIQANFDTKYKQFLDRNPWYVPLTDPRADENFDKISYAEAVDRKLRFTNPELVESAQHFDIIEKRVNEHFKPKTLTSAVETGSSEAVTDITSDKNLYQKLPKHQKQMFDAIKKSHTEKKLPPPDIKQYYVRCKEIGEIL